MSHHGVWARSPGRVIPLLSTSRLSADRELGDLGSIGNDIRYSFLNRVKIYQVFDRRTLLLFITELTLACVASAT